MKKWNNPAVEELNINETAMHIIGTHWDGGTFDDDEIGVLAMPGHTCDERCYKNGNGNTGNEETNFAS